MYLYVLYLFYAFLDKFLVQLLPILAFDVLCFFNKKKCSCFSIWNETKRKRECSKIIKIVKSG